MAARIPGGMSRSVAREGLQSDPPTTQGLPGSWDRSNARLQKSLAQEWSVPAPLLELSALPALFADAAAESNQAQDSDHRSVAIASRQRAQRLLWKSKSARTTHRACRAWLPRCRRAPV